MSAADRGIEAEAKEAPEAAAPRRQPSQQRSRERLERILAVAMELIARGGADHLKMSEVATTAGISIGSLYQYAPDKAALIRILAERFQAENRRCVEAALAVVADAADLRRRFCELIDICYAMILKEPVYRDVWSGMQADKALAVLELEESRRCGDILAGAVLTVWPDADRDGVRLRCFLMWQLGEATFRLATAVDAEEGARLVEAYKRMSWNEIEDAARRGR